VLLGHPVAHSLSPRFQNAALARAGLTTRYEALDVEPAELASVLQQLISERAAGNVTVPHKATVAAACARRTSIAERVGAVNVFWVEDGRLIGDNTDVGGFDHAVRQLRPASAWPTRIAILGSGGSAAAVLAAVGEWPGARASVWGRTRAHADALAARFPTVAIASPTLEGALDGADLVVNATPVGLDGASLPMDVDRLPRGVDVLDLVYRPGETAWVRAARARGHRAADGLAMLVEQGALAFERWFGVAPDRAAMWAAVSE
jgi:shikimate dehydrogenase